jgi:hypothetical protein
VQAIAFVAPRKKGQSNDWDEPADQID